MMMDDVVFIIITMAVAMMVILLNCNVLLQILFLLQKLHLMVV